MEVVKRREDREVRLATYGPGDFFGEVSLLDPQYSKHSATIRALEETTVTIMGKIGIPDSVLLKKGKLDDSEWEIMKTHPQIGASCLEGSSSSMLQKAAVIALSHHERWDGKGYPSGLKHEEIPLEGRMLSIVDVFDALTTERPYKRAWSREDAVRMIREAIGSQFDPKTTLVFLDNISEFCMIKDKYTESPDDELATALT